MSIIVAYYLIKSRNQTKEPTVYVYSKLNQTKYMVLNRPDKEEAAYLLSEIHVRILILRDYLMKNIDKYPEYKYYILRMCERIDKIVLQENIPGGKHTSFTKGKSKMWICLRNKETGQLHQINLLMYIVLHELAHFASPYIGFDKNGNDLSHNDLFKYIFIFLLKISIQIKIYKYVDYRINPHEYCGIVVFEKLF